MGSEHAVDCGVVRVNLRLHVQKSETCELRYEGKNASEYQSIKMVHETRDQTHHAPQTRGAANPSYHTTMRARLL